jgi:hypothetical protein
MIELDFLQFHEQKYREKRYELYVLTVMSTNHCEKVSTNDCENVLNTSMAHE